MSKPDHGKLIVGLTGGIGSGKSTVASLFANLGAGIVDTDEIAHRLTQANGAAIAAIRAAFGADFIGDDGAMNRAKMRELVFSDKVARQRLESILHPAILEQAKLLLQQLQQKPYIILVVPLLPESIEFQQLVHRILVVDCNEDAQIARVCRRSSMDEQQVRVIITLQTPRTERLQLADDVISNNGTPDDLAEQVKVLHERYSNMQNNH